MEFTDEQIRALLRDPARHPPSARHLGFELMDFSVDEGWAEVGFTPRPEFANPAGMVQGGFVCAMLDDAMGVTASISQRFAILVPTLQISVSFLRPTPLSRVIGRGEVLRMGGSTAHLAAACACRTARSSPPPRPARCCGRFRSDCVGCADPKEGRTGLTPPARIRYTYPQRIWYEGAAYRSRAGVSPGVRWAHALARSGLLSQVHDQAGAGHGQSTAWAAILLHAA